MKNSEKITEYACTATTKKGARTATRSGALTDRTAHYYKQIRRLLWALLWLALLSAEGWKPDVMPVGYAQWAALIFLGVNLVTFMIYDWKDEL